MEQTASWAPTTSTSSLEERPERRTRRSEIKSPFLLHILRFQNFTHAPSSNSFLRLGVLQGLMPNDVDVTLTPEELEGLDEAGIKALYEEKLAEARSSNRHEDLSDMVRQNAAAQKRKLAAKSDDKAGKKAKESFKF